MWLRPAIGTAHEGDEDDLSDYYLAHKIRAAYCGMMVVLPPVFWPERFAYLGTEEMAPELLDVAQDVNSDHYHKNRRGPNTYSVQATSRCWPERQPEPCR